MVRPPQQSMDSIGKLMHPAPATLYKIMRVPGTMNYSVVKSPSGEAVFQIEKVGWFVSVGWIVEYICDVCRCWSPSIQSGRRWDCWGPTAST